MVSQTKKNQKHTRGTKKQKHPLNNIKKNMKNKPNKKRHITTKKNHQRKVLPIVYGKIHMFGCGHCVNLIPEWDIVNENMKIHLDVVCYDIEREEETPKLQEFNNNYKPYEPLQIQGGYPTIYKLHKRGGAIIYYNGPRDHQSMLMWLQGK